MRLILGGSLLVLFFALSCPCFAQESGAGSLADLPLPAAQPEHDFGDNSPDVLLCMGDSITQGYGVSASDSYPAKLQAMLGRAVINEGLGGARSTYGVRMIRTYLDRYKPGYVLILFGANDIGENSEDEIVENLRNMVHRAKENKTMSVLATLTPVSGSRIGKKSTIIRVNDRIRALVTQEGILLADVAAAFNWEDRYLMSDGLHPTAEGLELVAKTFYDTIVEFERNDSGGGGGGGCTTTAAASAGGDWLLLLAALMAMFFAPRICSRKGE